MKDLSKVLEDINSAIERYELCKLGLVHDQSEILRDLSVNAHWLTVHKIELQEDWLKAFFESSATSSVAKERDADRLVPFLYKARNYEKSSEKVLNSIRSTISANKNQN